jgi:hypothetical protein
MRTQVINTNEINYIFSMFEKYANELFIVGLNYYLYKPELNFCFEFFENKLYKIKNMTIELAKYDDENQNEILDLTKDFDNQTAECKKYITDKTDVTEIPCSRDDGHNRQSIRKFQYTDGFIVTFAQTYENNESAKIENQTVTIIESI